MNFLSRNLAKVNSADSPAHGIITAAITAGLTLVEPRALGVGARLAYRCAIAGCSAWSVWVAARSSTATAPYLPPLAHGALAAGAAGVTLGLAEASEALDARLHDGLLRAGVTQPRIVLAAASGAAGLASWWFASRSNRAGTTHDDLSDDLPGDDVLVALPEAIRALAAKILGASDAHAAPDLRVQLAEARMVAGDPNDTETPLWPGVQFAVPAHLPLAVPASATFPVLGRFVAIDDRTFDVRLFIEEGRLTYLSVTEGGDWSDDDRAAWHAADRSVGELTEWPTVDAVSLWVETSAGVQPHA